MRAAIYARMSTDKQSDTSPEERRIRVYADGRIEGEVESAIDLGRLRVPKHSQTSQQPAAPVVAGGGFGRVETIVAELPWAA